MKRQPFSQWSGVALAAWLGVAPGVAWAEDEPIAKPAEMKPAPKLVVPKIQNRSSSNLTLPGINQKLEAGLPLSRDEYQLHLLRQEMEYNPELKEKVEVVMEMMRQKKEQKASVKASEQASREQEANMWMNDGLRMMYQAQGKELPDFVKLSDNARGVDASRALEVMKNPVQNPLKTWQKTGKMANPSATDADEEEQFLRTGSRLMSASLADRLRYNRKRMTEARERFAEEESVAAATAETTTPPDPMATLFQNPLLPQPTNANEPEADNGVMAWPDPLEVGNGNAEVLAVIESDSAKETFEAGELQWFETKDETLPVASAEAAQQAAMSQGLVQGEFDMYLDKIKELNADLMAKEAERMNGTGAAYELSEFNMNRPNIDIPMEAFIKQANVDQEQVRKAEMIQDSLQRSKELRTKQLRPRMGLQSTRRIMTAHDMLGPHVFRPWERDRFERPQKPERVDK